MSTDMTEALAMFRAEARAWLEANVPAEPRPADGPELRAFDCSWQRRQYDGGWAGIDWDAAYGGRGLSLFEQVVWYEELVRIGAPAFSIFLVALNNVGPTLMLHGTEDQRRRWMPPILRGETPWCQLFSEPEAGSDLASLRCRGILDGDDVVVTGQKVWTSFAQHSDWGELLVRTDPDAGKHRGLTLLAVDMHSPGIDVRPINQIDGNPEFCEVFLDEVRVPQANVIGSVGQGWTAALATLAVERGPAVLDMRLASITLTDELVAEARRLGRIDGALDGGDLAERLALARAEAAANRAMAWLQVSNARPGQMPGPETTGIRTFHTELEQRIARLAIDLLGPDALADSRWSRHWLRQMMATIGGGTKDVQKNIIGERVLGLPR